MVKKKIKTIKIFAAHQILSGAKYGKLDDTEKIKVWHISRKLAPVAEKFDADSKDAAEKLKPGGDFSERWQKADEYREMIKTPNLDASTLPMGPSEYDAFMREYNKYNKIVNDAMTEVGNKEVEVEFEPISEDTFAKLMTSNDWSVGQAVAVGDLVTE